MTTYFALFTRDDKYSAWSFHFGDYDAEVVMDEQDDVVAGGVLRSNTKRIITSDAQEEIQARLDIFNS